jgi:hypothetical protein
LPDPDNEGLYADDPDHPLPQMMSLDMVAKRRTGGADLMILIAGPLQADERSQRRLLRKFDLYLGFIGSPDYAREFGAPDPVTTRIVVRIDPASDPRVFDLLGRCEPWVREGRAALVVESPAGGAH